MDVQHLNNPSTIPAVQPSPFHTSKGMAVDRPNRRRSLQDACSRFLQKVFHLKSQAKKGARLPAQWLASLGPEGQGFDRRIVPQLIDRIAEKRPHALWVSIPKTANPGSAFREITYRQLAHSVDRAAIWLERAIGVGATGQKIAYLAMSEISSIILTLAASKLDCQIIFLSPRNTLDGQIFLLDAVDCHFLATPKTQPSQTAAILAQRQNLRHIITPELEELLNGPVPAPRPFIGTFEEVRHKALFYVHSSGTTSLPKPVGWTHGANAHLLHELTFTYPEGQMVLQNMVATSTKLYSTFPMFHAGGIIFPLVHAPMCGTECVLPPQGVPVTAKLSNQMYTSSKAPFAVLEPPMITEEVVKDPVYFKNLLKQPIVMTGAAALSRPIGDKIVKHGVPVRNLVAASETCIPPLLVPSPDSEWQAFSFAKGQGLEMEHVKDGQHELVYHKLKDGRRTQAIFENFPELDVYRTNDMFVKHPDPGKPGLWLIAGRADDVIVLLNGEKFTPTALEEELQAHTEVKGVLVFGMQREQAALLVEPADATISVSASASQDFINRLWPVVERANSRIPAHGRIMQTHILVTKPEKPMLRTPKGSVQRNRVFDLYASEMDELYRRYSVDSSSDATAVQAESSDASSVNLKHRICKLLDIQPDNLDEDTNIFAAGFDSLHTMQLTRELQQCLGRQNFEQVLIYNNPTVRQLSYAISGRASPRRNSRIYKEAKRNEYDTSNIASLVSNISRNLFSAPTPSSSRIAILTGCSGGLGQHLLEQLRSNYTHIYCLLRQPPSTTQHPALPNVTYLDSDLAAPLLGLAPAQHAVLLRDATHIIHNAWLVDFNQPLPFFAKNIDGVRGLISFAATARRNPRIFFISSVGAVVGMAPEGTTPGGDAAIEEIIHPLNDSSDVCVKPAAHAMGYAQSKRVAELLLAKASAVSGVRVAICRIGQIAGTSVGGITTREGRMLPSWQKRDWLPRLLASAKSMRSLPSSLGGVDCSEWMAIDHVATAVLELLEAGDDGGADDCQVFHLVNPAPNKVKWENLLPVMRLVLGDGNPDAIQVVSPKDWIEVLENTTKAVQHDGKEAIGSAGAQLLGFYKTLLLHETPMPRLDMSKAIRASQAFRHEPGMNAVWMEQWLKEWFPTENAS